MGVTAYIGYIASQALSPYIDGPALFVATLLCAAFGGGVVALFVERVAFRRLRNQGSPVIYYFISSITMGILLENLITVAFSSNFYSYPKFFPVTLIHLGSINIAVSDLMMLGFSSAALGLLLWVIYGTKMGIAMRAVSFDVNTAQLMGMDANRVVMMTFIAAGVLGGISGVFLGINYTLYPQLGQLITKGFIASVIGGLGSISGALMGAILLGVAEVFLIGLVGAGWVPVCLFGIMILFFLVRPRGISGVIVQEKV